MSPIVLTAYLKRLMAKLVENSWITPCFNGTYCETNLCQLDMGQASAPNVSLERTVVKGHGRQVGRKSIGNFALLVTCATKQCQLGQASKIA